MELQPFLCIREFLTAPRIEFFPVRTDRRIIQSFNPGLVLTYTSIVFLACPCILTGLLPREASLANVRSRECSEGKVILINICPFGLIRRLHPLALMLLSCAEPCIPHFSETESEAVSLLLASQSSNTLFAWTKIFATWRLFDFGRFLATKGHFVCAKDCSVTSWKDKALATMVCRDL